MSDRCGADAQDEVRSVLRRERHEVQRARHGRLQHDLPIGRGRGRLSFGYAREAFRVNVVLQLPRRLPQLERHRGRPADARGRVARRRRRRSRRLVRNGRRSTSPSRSATPSCFSTRSTCSTRSRRSTTPSRSAATTASAWRPMIRSTRVRWDACSQWEFERGSSARRTGRAGVRVDPRRGSGFDGASA